MAHDMERTETKKETEIDELQPNERVVENKNKNRRKNSPNTG